MKHGFAPGKDWKYGAAPFSYGYKEAGTELTHMRSNHSALYLTREFEVENADYISEIGIMARYDDAFIAYLNGHEVVRKSVGKGAGKDAKEIKAGAWTEKYRYFPLKDFEKHLKDGPNVLAIEGHNHTKESSDFLLDPFLVIED